MLLRIHSDSTMNHWSVMIMTNGDGDGVDCGENGDGCKDGTHTNPYKLIPTHTNSYHPIQTHNNPQQPITSPTDLY